MIADAQGQDALGGVCGLGCVRPGHHDKIVQPDTRGHTCGAGAAVSKAPSMQLYQEGILQGITVDAIPGAERPKNLDGTMVGDIGFDPLGFSNWLDLNWAREAEIKHGRVAMLAATGMIVQDIAVIPGFDKEFSGAAMMKLHNLAVQQVLLACQLSCPALPCAPACTVQAPPHLH
jgi:hypothetical protein